MQRPPRWPFEQNNRYFVQKDTGWLPVSFYCSCQENHGGTVRQRWAPQARRLAKPRRSGSYPSAPPSPEGRDGREGRSPAPQRKKKGDPPFGGPPKRCFRTPLHPHSTMQPGPCQAPNAPGSGASKGGALRRPSAGGGRQRGQAQRSRRSSGGSHREECADVCPAPVGAANARPHGGAEQGPPGGRAADAAQPEARQGRGQRAAALPQQGGAARRRRAEGLPEQRAAHDPRNGGAGRAERKRRASPSEAPKGRRGPRCAPTGGGAGAAAGGPRGGSMCAAHRCSPQRSRE